MSKKLISGIVLIVCGILFYPTVELILSRYAYEKWPMSVQIPLSIAFFVSFLALLIFGIISLVQAIRSSNDYPKSRDSFNPNSIKGPAFIFLGCITFVLGILSGSLLAIAILLPLGLVCCAVGLVLFDKDQKTYERNMESDYTQNRTPPPHTCPTPAATKQPPSSSDTVYNCNYDDNQNDVGDSILRQIKRDIQNLEDDIKKLEKKRDVAQASLDLAMERVTECSIQVSMASDPSAAASWRADLRTAETNAAFKRDHVRSLNAAISKKTTAINNLKAKWKKRKYEIRGK